MTAIRTRVGAGGSADNSQEGGQVTEPQFTSLVSTRSKTIQGYTAVRKLAFLHIHKMLAIDLHKDIKNLKYDYI